MPETWNEVSVAQAIALINAENETSQREIHILSALTGIEKEKIENWNLDEAIMLFEICNNLLQSKLLPSSFSYIFLYENSQFKTPTNIVEKTLAQYLDAILIAKEKKETDVEKIHQQARVAAIYFLPVIFEKKYDWMMVESYYDDFIQKISYNDVLSFYAFFFAKLMKSKERTLKGWKKFLHAFSTLRTNPKKIKPDTIN